MSKYTNTEYINMGGSTLAAGIVLVNLIYTFRRFNATKKWQLLALVAANACEVVLLLGSAAWDYTQTADAWQAISRTTRGHLETWLGLLIAGSHLTTMAFLTAVIISRLEIAKCAESWIKCLQGSNICLMSLGMVAFSLRTVNKKKLFSDMNALTQMVLLVYFIITSVTINFRVFLYIRSVKLQLAQQGQLDQNSLNRICSIIKLCLIGSFMTDIIGVLFFGLVSLWMVLPNWLQPVYSFSLAIHMVMESIFSIYIRKMQLRSDKFIASAGQDMPKAVRAAVIHA